MSRHVFLPGSLATIFVLFASLFSSQNARANEEERGSQRLVPPEPGRDSLETFAKAFVRAGKTSGLVPNDGTIAAVVTVSPRGGDDRLRETSVVARAFEEALADDHRRVHALDHATQHDETARARDLARRGFRAWVFADVVVEGGYAVAKGRGFALGEGGLAEFVVPNAEPRPRFEVRMRLDGRLASILAPRPSLDASRLRAEPIELPSRGYLAILPFDIRARGRDALLLVTDHDVTALRIERQTDGSLTAVPTDAELLPALPFAAGAPRRAFATARVGEGTATVRSSTYAVPVRVSLGESLAVELASNPCRIEEGFPLLDSCAARVAGRDYFRRELEAELPTAPPLMAPSTFYARVVESFSQPDGSVQRVEAVITPRGRLAMRIDDREVGLAGCGAALSLADLDLDGRPEVLTSSPRGPDAGDELRLLRLRKDTSLVTVFRSEELRGSVMQATSADVDGDGYDELLAIEEPRSTAAEDAKLWILR